MSTLKSHSVNNPFDDLLLKVNGNTIVDIQNVGDVRVKKLTKALMYQTVNVIDGDYSLQENRSSLSVGPITVASGTVTVANNAVWVIV